MAPVAVAAPAPVTSVRSGGTAPVAAAGATGSRTAPLRTPAAVAAYRTLTAQSAQLFEQARDSVFKQIMLKLGKEGGGEMRVRLEPPELGQLDVQVSVEKSGQMKLWLDAQRPELAAMLDRNLEALKQTLGQQGFTVVHAEVRDGNRSDRRWENNDAGAGAGIGSEAELAAATPRSQGWITADGLDFWV